MQGKILWMAIAVVVSLLSGMMGDLHAKDKNAVAKPEPKHQYKKLPKRERPTWRFEFANDVFFGSDNQFTNGFTFQKFSTISENLDDLAGTWAWGKRIARGILPSKDGLFYRKGITFGQDMQTPEDIEDPDIILDDVPYLGLLASGTSWIAFDDKRFTGYGITVGIVGEYSFAEQLQSAVHELTDSTEPQGWDNQLDNEPVFNFYYMKKRKLWRNRFFDGAFNVGVAAGNFVTSAHVSLETRFGRMPGGFVYLQDPIGTGMAYDATIPREDVRTEIYGSAVVRATGLAVFMPLEGNILVSDNEWTDNNTIDPENFLGQVILGFHIVRPGWGIHVTWFLTTDTVDRDSLSADEDPTADFSTLMIEWRF